MTTNERNEQDLERLRQAVRDLREFFDSVQIFATRVVEPGEREEPDEEGATMKLNSGGGNWYARYGQILDWINCEEANARAADE